MRCFCFLVLLGTFDYIMALITCKLYDSLLDYLFVLLFIWFCVHSHVCGVVTMEDLVLILLLLIKKNNGGSKREGTCVFWLCVEGKGGNYVNQNAR